MFGSLFKRSASKRKLRPDDVRGLVRQFVDDWSPFHDSYGQAPDIAVEWVKDGQGNGTWVAGIIPAWRASRMVLADNLRNE